MTASISDWRDQTLDLSLPFVDGYESRRFEAGFIRNDEWLVPPIYNYAWVDENGGLRAERDNRYYLLNQNGKVVAEQKYVSELKNSLAVFRDDEGKMGLLDESGIVHLKPRFFDLSSFSGKTFRAQEKEKALYGIVDSQGTWIVKPSFHYLGHFANGAAEYQDGENLVGLVDKTGTITVPARWQQIGYFNKYGVTVAKQNDKWGLINSKGNWLVDPLNEDYWSPPSDGGPTAFKKSNRWGYVNSKGDWIIEPRFTDAASFSEGIAAVKDASGKTGLIDEKGNWILLPKFDTIASGFRDGRATVADESGLFSRYGLIDKKGEIVVPVAFDGIEHTGSGIFRLKYGEMTTAKDDNYYGLIGEVYMTKTGRFFPTEAVNDYLRYLLTCRGLMLDAQTWTHTSDWISVPDVFRAYIACFSQIQQWTDAGDKDAIYFNFWLNNDSGKSVKNWLIAAAEAGHPRAQQNLANSYQYGRPEDNIYVNADKAIFWYTQAALQGEPTAQFALGAIYGLGEVTEQDVPQAYYWTKQAIQNGRSDPYFVEMRDAKRNLRILKRLARQGNSRPVQRQTTVNELWNSFSNFAGKGGTQEVDRGKCGNGAGYKLWHNPSWVEPYGAGTLTPHTYGPTANAALQEFCRKFD